MLGELFHKEHIKIVYLSGSFWRVLAHCSQCTMKHSHKKYKLIITYILCDVKYAHQNAMNIG